MNTYSKFVPNVFLAKCSEMQAKGETITMQTKYGREHDCIVFNLIFQKEGFYYYSVVRADGFNVQEYAKRKAEKLQNAASNAEKKSNAYYEASQEGKEFLSLGEPIKVGHHSERRHRALIERNWDRMGKSVEQTKIAQEYESRAEYWKSREDIVNLSMPESLEYFEFKLEQAKMKHEGIKNGSIPKQHSYSLTYAKNEVNELQKKVELAKRLWE